MKKRHEIVLALLTAASLVFMVGCIKWARSSADSAEKGPEWVTKGSGAFDDKGPKVFYGVGLASGINNKALLRQTADDRARAEIAKVIETYVAVLSKDYMVSTSADQIGQSTEEQQVQSAIKSFTKQTLKGAEIIERWVDPEDGVMYSLCRMELADIKAAAENDENLDSKIRDYVRENADEMHTEMQEMETE